MAPLSLEIVPAELLARPLRDEARRLERDGCALQLDPYLRRLASQEARCRRTLGTVAGEFLRRRAHHLLGFARVGDYARERLGLSGRELQSVARVVATLPRLPALAAAFDQGALSWTQLRLLAPVALAETEQEWLALARGRTVRALEALIRSAKAGAGTPRGAVPPSVPADAAPMVDAALEECAVDDSVVEGEPEVTFRLRCPRWVPSIWREVVELARRVAGEPLPVWGAAEAIAVEGLGAVDSRPRSVESHAGAPFPSGGDEDGRSSGTARGKDGDPDPDETRDVFAAGSGLDTIDWSLVVEALPADVERLAHDVAACDAHGLDERMRAVMDALRRVDWQLGRLLRLFMDCRLHELFGFPSWATYVRERLGMSTSAARLLVALERKTWASPALMDAYRSGALSSLRAFTIAPVVSERHGDRWVARAGAVTLRRLTDEVGWALDVRDTRPWAAVAPPPLGAALVPPPRQMRAPLDEDAAAVIVFRGPASVIALFRNAVAAFHPPLTPGWTGLIRLLAHAQAEWERLPRHRDPVFARDGWRCAVPACSSRRNLQDHHVLFRSRGGDNARDNRIAICAWHHLRGIHRGRVRAWGRAPEAIRWELGVRHESPPLLRLVGDVYAREEGGARCTDAA